jgi:hypothetical protein
MRIKPALLALVALIACCEAASVVRFRPSIEDVVPDRRVQDASNTPRSMPT